MYTTVHKTLEEAENHVDVVKEKCEFEEKNNEHFDYSIKKHEI